MEKEIKPPKFRIVPDINSQELMPMDIVIRINKEGIELRCDEDLKNTLDTILNQEGEFFIKVNWWSEDLLLILPSKNTSETSQEAPGETIDTKSIVLDG